MAQRFATFCLSIIISLSILKLDISWQHSFPSFDSPYQLGHVEGGDDKVPGKSWAMGSEDSSQLLTLNALIESINGCVVH